MVNQVHVIDPDVRRRALVSRELHSQPLHVEIYESIDEFIEVAPVEGLILLADIPDAVAHNVGQIARESAVPLPVVAYAEAPTSRDVVEAMLAGVQGYLEWPFDHAGLGPALARMADEGQRKLRRKRHAFDARAKIKALSGREKQVLVGLIGGLSNKDLGQALSISPRTVEIHRSNMMVKLKARSVADAVRIGIYAGLDEDENEWQFYGI